MKRLSFPLALLLCASALHAEQHSVIPGVRITGIAQVRLYTATPETSTAFYRQLIGLDRTETGSSAIFQVNDLQSIEVSPLPSPAPISRVEAVVFRTTDAAALERYLRSHAIPITEPLGQSKDHSTFGVHDPEGNLIRFTQSATGPTQPSPRATARRIIHAGFVVKDRKAEDSFYQDLLGFHLYWQGGQKDGVTDYVAMQVPDGSDWLEYMLNVSPDASAHQLGVCNHLSLGLDHMADAVSVLHRNGCLGAECSKTQLGRDGKVQLNLFDPDQTRIEYMEFKPVGTPCCSPILGKAPTEKEDH